MGVMIELTTEQEEAVLAAYGYTAEIEAIPTPPAPTPPAPPPPEVLPVPFEDLAQMPFGTSHNGLNMKLPLTGANGAVTWKFFIGDELALEAGVATSGGSFHCHQVQDELEKWPPGKGYEDIIAKINAMGLEPTDYAIFTKDNMRHVDLPGVRYDGRDWRLEMWQQGTVRYIQTGPGLIPPNVFALRLGDAGSYLKEVYNWS